MEQRRNSIKSIMDERKKENSTLLGIITEAFASKTSPIQTAYVGAHKGAPSMRDDDCCHMPVDSRYL